MVYYLELWRPSWSAEWDGLCNFVEGIMGNIHVKLFYYGQVVQEVMLSKEKVYARRPDARTMDAGKSLITIAQVS